MATFIDEITIEANEEEVIFELWADRDCAMSLTGFRPEQLAEELLDFDWSSTAAELDDQMVIFRPERCSIDVSCNPDVLYSGKLTAGDVVEFFEMAICSGSGIGYYNRYDFDEAAAKLGNAIRDEVVPNSCCIDEIVLYADETCTAFDLNHEGHTVVSISRLSTSDLEDDLYGYDWNDVRYELERQGLSYSKDAVESVTADRYENSRTVQSIFDDYMNPEVVTSFFDMAINGTYDNPSYRYTDYDYDETIKTIGYNVAHVAM